MRKTTAAIAMFIGGMLYVSSRSESLIMFRWFDVMGLRNEVQAFRALTVPYLELFPKWVYLSLPQALWYFSGLLAFECIWGSMAATCRQRCAWVLTFSGMALGLEIGQWLHLVPGRFDILDLAFMLLAWSVVVIISSLERRRLLSVQLGGS